jgi:NAD(P)-dependent dehydrogenase (short-subunit alcohol dehydrogenase family)
MTGRMDEKVVIVTGAGRGIGRGEALEFARHGAKVIVNDCGAERDGSGRQSAVALAVVEEIKAAGGVAIANAEDVSDWHGAQRLVESAIDNFGRLDVLVNNAGILRDRTIANMTESEWDDVIRVHLRGTLSTLRHAASHWKERARAGEMVDARVINTSSGSGLFGNPGQSNYGAAKAAIASLTVIASQELARYGVKVNAIAPVGLTRMTEDRPVAAAAKALRESGSTEFNRLDPDHVAPVVVWLSTEAAKDVTGRVLLVAGGSVGVAEPWQRGPSQDKGARWEVEELDTVVPSLLDRARGNVQTGRVG